MKTAPWREAKRDRWGIHTLAPKRIAMGVDIPPMQDSRFIERDASINHERMPALLSDPADFETWLSGSTEDAFKLARSYAADQMRIVQSGSERKDLLAA